MFLEPEDIIKKLNLIPLPGEGGYFRQTWISDIDFEKSRIPANGGENIPLGSAIYFLLVNSLEGFSALHTLSGPEIYHFYLGDPMELSLFHKNGKVEQIIMGQNILKGELLQFVVPPGVIQGSRILEGGRFALMGTTMSPGFTSDDFYLNSRKEMLIKYSKHKKLVKALTRE